jgi:hypothetical protein
MFVGLQLWTRVALSIFTKAVCSQIASKRETVVTALRYDHNEPWILS